MRAFKWSPLETPRVKRNGAGKLGCCCAECDIGNSQVASITINSATVTGAIVSSEFCGEVDVSFTGSAGPHTCEGCVSSCYTSAPLAYSCPAECAELYPVQAEFEIECSLYFDGVTWMIGVSTAIIGTICHWQDFFVGGTFDLDVGADPSGTHSFTFDDPEFPPGQITYTASVTVVL